MDLYKFYHIKIDYYYMLNINLDLMNRMLNNYFSILNTHFLYLITVVHNITFYYIYTGQLSMQVFSYKYFGLKQLLHSLYDVVQVLHVESHCKHYSFFK